MVEQPIRERLSEYSRKQRAKQVERQQARFLAGPIPIAWLSTACRLPGKALHVGLAIWYRKRVFKKPEVPVTPHLLETFGVDRRTGYRALANLEAADLVKVDRRRGRSPRVTIQEPDKKLKVDE